MFSIHTKLLLALKKGLNGQDYSYSVSHHQVKKIPPSIMLSGKLCYIYICYHQNNVPSRLSPHCFHENIYITLILLFLMKTYILRSSIYLHLPGYISFIFNLIKRLHQIPRGGGCSWGSTKLAANAAKNLFWLRYSE